MLQAYFKRLNTQLDTIDEYEREPVPENELKGWRGFLGMYAGEHTAGTEFVIGPLFVAHGVAAIEVKTKRTLYWQLKKICGSKLALIYNVVNALMFCFLAGAMIAVSATAVGLPFGIAMPGLGDWLPTSLGWVITVFAVGLVIT